MYINRVSDPNSGGGVVVSTSQTFVKANGQYIATDGDPVSAHGPTPHDAPVTANGQSWFTINGIPVNINGDSDTCGHPRASSQSWFDVL